MTPDPAREILKAGPSAGEYTAHHPTMGSPATYLPHRAALSVGRSTRETLIALTRVVCWIDVSNSGRPNSVNLDHRFFGGIGEMFHTLRCAREATRL